MSTEKIKIIKKYLTKTIGYAILCSLFDPTEMYGAYRVEYERNDNFRKSYQK
jgi:hypothetical protein